MKIIKVSAIFKTTNAGDGKLIIEFQGPNGSTGLDWRFKNRCHFLPSMGLQLEALKFSCVQNNRDSSVAYVTCIYRSLNVKITCVKRRTEIVDILDTLSKNREEEEEEENEQH